MDENKIFDLRDDALAAAREIAEPTARIGRTLDLARYARDEGEYGALIDETADLAREIEDPKERSLALTQVLRALRK